MTRIVSKVGIGKAPSTKWLDVAGDVNIDAAFSVGGITSIYALLTSQIATNTEFLEARTVGGANASFSIRRDGRISWGAGVSVATDTFLYRSAASTLRTSGNFIVDLALTAASFDVPTAANLSIGASVGANLITLGGSTSTTIIPGALSFGSAQAWKYGAVITSATYTVQPTDFIIPVDTATSAMECTIQLPSALGTNRVLIIKDVGHEACWVGQEVYMQPASGQFIEDYDANMPYAIKENGGSLTLISNGSNGWIIL